MPALCTVVMIRPVPNKQETFTQCWFNIGPPSSTLAQHWTSTGWTFRVCWVRQLLYSPPHRARTAVQVLGDSQTGVWNATCPPPWSSTYTAPRHLWNLEQNNIWMIGKGHGNCQDMCYYNQHSQEENEESASSSARPVHNVGSSGPWGGRWESGAGLQKS